ncbi:endonuclease V isoform X2 [Canna indica]|uniref:Endonuclease V isoform X2 n=1 Tax=Canna indica TaxID=4628 RepID=A0AAQ3KRF1_9LILI|nr:endonuclease V isoform X2 [Canna indica]
MVDSSSQEEGVISSSCHREWMGAQESLKKQLILEDDFSWEVPSQGWASEDGLRMEKLKYIGGLDISFLKEDPSVACGALVVLDGETLEVVYKEFDVTRLQVPYVLDFLAFREVFNYLILHFQRFIILPFWILCTQLGLLSLIHCSGLGLACHLGILANLPTIGIGKNLHHVDGLTQSAVMQCLEARENYNKDMISLTGKSSKIWGMSAGCLISDEFITLSLSKKNFVEDGQYNS